MVYVDGKGQKYEFRYCVVLKEGKNAGLRQYRWASKEQINNAKDMLKNQKKDDFYSIHNGELKNSTDLVEIVAVNEENANSLAGVLGLPLPFPNRK